MSTEKHTIIIIIIAFMLTVIAYISQIIGYNTTNSVPFKLYYHTEFTPSDMATSNYIMFESPPNELYGKSLAVKKISCLSGQYLESRRIESKIEYYCDDILISVLTVFNRLTGEPLTVFEYSGVIPDGHLFVTGSSETSYDSKYWGFLPISNITRLVHPIYFFKKAHAADGYISLGKDGFYQYAVQRTEDNSTVDNNTPKFVMPVIPWAELPTMHPDNFSTLFKEVENYAMSHRTLENFDTYAKMRTVLVKRSMEFMNVGTLWAQLNPEDTNESWFPTSGFGQAAYQAEADTIRMDYIRQNKNEYALLYMYRDDCAYCQKQAPLIRYFEDKTGWIVKPVDTAKFPESLLRFNIQSVPSLILLERQTERALPLSSGLMTYEEIMERLYRTIKYLKGESNEIDFIEPIRPNNLVRTGTR